ncbi:MAG: uncharacterized protein PWQ41_1635 [Bacillota bacterium]|jgi:hypothetical protein|nr:uncharacterized protein [Bacillota bacterium]MDK2925861.1 uncharacterized protein [Bacillota bacterium]
MSLFERLARLRAERAEATRTPEADSAPSVACSAPESFKAQMATPERVPDEGTFARRPPVPAARFGASEVQTACGSFCRRTRPLAAALPAFLGRPERILANLKLIWGIGPVTEAALKAQGVRSLSDLTEHPRWGEEARRVLALVDARRAAELRRRGASDQELLGLFQPHEVACLDIETTGLWGNQPLFLVGLLRLEGGRPVLEQLLARHYSEEKALLTYLAEVLAGVRAVITFNGKRFDLPYIEQRFIYHGLPQPKELFHVDLYFHARRLPQALPNHRLVTLEAYLLGTEREGDVPGYLVPTIYHRFVRTGEPELLLPVLEHNAQDVLSLARLLYLVGQEGEGGCGDVVRSG